MFDSSGNDLGYQDDPNWWYGNGPNRFRMSHPNDDYPLQYFPLAKPGDQAIQNYVKYVDQFYEKIAKFKLDSVIEFGAAAGWITKEFMQQGIEITAIEGSAAGCHLLDEANIDYLKHDLRVPLESMRIYDIALCTEVAEHIPICFHAVLVRSLTDASNMVWFSSEGPEVDNKAHLHHVAEMPLDYWIKLFDWFGYGCFMLPDYVMTETEGRGRVIFYNSKVYRV